MILWVWCFSLYLLTLQTSVAGMETLGWFTAIVTIAILVRKKGKFEPGTFFRVGPDWALGVFFITVVISSWLGIENKSEALDTIGWARWIPLLYLIVYGIKISELKLPRWVPIALVSITTVIALICFYQFFSGHNFIRPGKSLNPTGSFFRAVGFFNLPLTFAYVMGIFGCVYLSFFLWPPPEKSWRPLALVGFVSATLAVLLSMTRGAWLAYIVAVVLLFALKRRRLAIHAAVVVLLLFVVLYFTVDGFQSRLQALVDLEGPSKSSRYRLALWESYWTMFLDHPWWGVGLTRGDELLAVYFPRLGIDNVGLKSDAHNAFLQVLAGTGIFGFISYMWFCGYYVCRSWSQFRLRRTSWQGGIFAGLLAAQIFTHLGGLTECNFTDLEVNHSVIVTWALISALPVFKAFRKN